MDSQASEVSRIFSDMLREAEPAPPPPAPRNGRGGVAVIVLGLVIAALAVAFAAHRMHSAAVTAASRDDTATRPSTDPLFQPLASEYTRDM